MIALVGSQPQFTHAQAGVEHATSADEFLRMDIKRNDELVVGQLANGLRYVVMPNKTPPQRFEAHLEMHAGSVDEKEHEQVGVPQRSANRQSHCSGCWACFRLL